MINRIIPEGVLEEDKITLELTDEANQLYEKNRFGNIERKKLHLSLLEALYLVEGEKLIVKKGKKEVPPNQISRLARKKDKRFNIRYSVFKDLRDRGYVTKTALKFGADFRVYDRGVSPGEDHAKWIVFAVKESEHLTWREWSAKNRVANSTKKRLLIAVVDDEESVSYWESRWIRP